MDLAFFYTVFYECMHFSLHKQCVSLDLILLPFFPFASFFKDRTMFATCISSPLLQSKAPYTFTIFCLFTSLVMNIFDSNSATITNVTCSSNVPLSNCVRDPPGIYPRDRLLGYWLYHSGFH